MGVRSGDTGERKSQSSSSILYLYFREQRNVSISKVVSGVLSLSTLV